jgi:CheY-like chemotaxis protein/HPt (histidine-containing phosphotransfer) domain-containing protein
MNGVIGMTSLLLETPLDPQQREYAETIRTSGEVLLTVIDDILDFSKIEAGKLTIESRPFDLPASVDAVVRLLAPRAAEHGLALTGQVDQDVPRGLVGDEVRVRQIMLNLVGNAIKFTERGTVELRVSSGPRHPPPDPGPSSSLAPRPSPLAPRPSPLVTIAVHDTGVGIPAEKLAQMFERFTQADQSTAREYGGTGLGLAISKRLVELMGGEIGAESETGRGSTFWVTLPLAPAVSGEALTPQPPLPTVGEGELGLGHGPRALGEGEPVGASLAAPAGGEAGASAKTSGTREEAGGPGEPASGAREGAGGASPAPTGSNVGAQFIAPTPTAPQFIVPTPPVPEVTRVLVVEDDPVGQRVTAHLVRRLGYTVDVVADGQAAIDAVAAASYALVLMDCQMPDVDGFMATIEIRRRESALGVRARRVPIVALTASRLDSDRERCLAAGMDEYLTKPIEGPQLTMLLERWAPLQDPVPERKPAPPASTATPAVKTPEQPPILDPAGLLGAGVAISPQYREIVDLFLEEVPRRLDALGAAATRGDRAQVARLAHTLAGSASSLGASRLAVACAGLEALARADSRPAGRDTTANGPGGDSNDTSAGGQLPPPGPSLTKAIDTVHRELRQLQAALAGSTAL